MINLFFNYYKDANSNRQAELDKCVSKNFDNKLINCVMFESQNRLKYSDYFKFINSYTSGDDVNIVSNLDIYFDETVSLCNKIRPTEFYIMGRWDVDRLGNARHANRPDSQDAWIFRGKINIEADFYLGLPGCDNRLAYEAKKAGYKVTNPSVSIKIYHLHISGVRNHSRKDNVPGPYYTLMPSALP